MFVNLLKVATGTFSLAPLGVHYGNMSSLTRSFRKHDKAG